jgi:glycosyltransferase involved in cell wall biosynthesis
MKVLFLVPYPLDSAPSQRFRFEQYFRYLDERGIEYKAQSFLDNKAWKVLYSQGKKWQKFLSVVRGFFRRDWQMLTIWSYDVVFIHREAAPIGPPLYELWIKLWGKKIIYDFDDAIWLPNTSDENRVVAGLKWHSKVAEICSWAWKVSVGNEYLADFGRRNILDQEMVVVTPTTIDMGYHKSGGSTLRPFDQAQGGSGRLGPRDSLPLVIGWTGTHSTSAYLEGIYSALETLNKKYNFKFLVISNKQPSRQLAVDSWQEWQKETEIEDLDQIDIGIMPMPDNDWTRGKCGFKALQFMALGKPVVASPVGVNTEIIQDGVNGFLASAEEEWVEKLSRLIEDPELRERLGKAGRKTVVERYSVEANKEKFLNLFDQ